MPETRWNVELLIFDGNPATSFSWDGKASSRSEAILLARTAYPDPASQYSVINVRCSRYTADSMTGN